MQKIRILAVDPGYEKLGIAVLEKVRGGKETLIHSECFFTKKSDKEKRWLLIGQKIKKVSKDFSPDLLAMENLFFNKNQKTAMLVSEARGIILYEAMLFGMQTKHYSPLEVKIAVTGYGRSDKSQVEEMVKRLVKIEKKGKLEDDEYDAIAVGLAACASFRFSDLG